jgi:DNA-binding transcriptional LysR family regulator
VPRLNVHHLHDFWAVAKEGHLTRAAARLHVSQSALSAQIKRLEGQLDQTLSTRTGRSLQLTEAGQLAPGYAESNFVSGKELMALLREGRREERQVMRIGAVATLSRNFQENFLRPLLDSRYRLRAEVDDMALLGLLARDFDSVALLPTVVGRDELRSGRLVEFAVVPGLEESFYAISVQRRFEPPLLKALLKQSPAEVLGAVPD